MTAADVVQIIKDKYPNLEATTSFYPSSAKIIYTTDYQQIVISLVVSKEHEICITAIRNGIYDYKNGIETYPFKTISGLMAILYKKIITITKYEQIKLF